MMDALFGIHIGNTSACLSIWKDEGRVEVVANDAGDRVTPTIVQWTPTTCVVGQAAQLEHFKNEMNTIVRNKQLLNDSISDEELQYLKSYVPYRINKTDKVVKYELLFEGKQHHVLPSEILASIMKKLHLIAKSAVGGNKELNAVLTVPLHFSTNSICLIKETAKKVGFNVLQVVDEPSSAALGAGLGCSNEDPPYHCLIYHIGGVSLDATVLLIQDGMFTVLNTFHKYDLGGTIFTEQLADFLKSEFQRQHKLTQLTDRGKYKLFAFAENIKQVLSIQNLAQCNAESVDGGLDLSCSVSRARFENMLGAYLSEIVSAMKNAIERSGLSPNHIKKVVLCGGSFKIPKLQEIVRDYLTSAEILNSTQSELISIGAAIQAGYCMKYQLIPSEPAIDVSCLALPLAIKIKNGESVVTQSYMVPEGSILPLKKHYYVDNVQKCVIASIDLGKDNALHLGSIVLDELEYVVNVDLDVNKDGILSVMLASEDGLKKKYFKYDLDRFCAI